METRASLPQPIKPRASTTKAGRARSAAFANVPVDEFLAAPVDFHELQIVLDRALDQRALEIENRRVTEQIAGRFLFDLGVSKHKINIAIAFQILTFFFA